MNHLLLNLFAAAFSLLLPFTAMAGPCLTGAQVGGGNPPTPCYGAYVYTQNTFRGYNDEDPSVTWSASYKGTGTVDSTVLKYPDTFSPGLLVNVFGTQQASVATEGSYRGESQISHVGADLQSNTLRLFVSGTPISSPSNSVQDSIVNAAFLRDQYTISFSKSIASVLVSIAMDINGTFEESYYKSGIGVQAQFQALSFAGYELGGGSQAGQYPTSAFVDDVLHMSFNLGGEVDMGDHWESSFDLISLLFNYSQPGTTMDFAHTASLSLVLPEGVTYRRASEIKVGAEVPEPGTIVLLGAGLLALAGIRAKRKQSGLHVIL